MYVLHLQRGVEIDGWNIDWLPYPRDSASLFHLPATTLEILRSCMLVVRHFPSSPLARRASPALPTLSDIPALLSPPLPGSLLQPPAVASLYIRSPIYRTRSETFKLLCLSRNIACSLLPVHFTRNKSNRELPYFPEDITITRYICMCRLRINNNAVYIAG